MRKLILILVSLVTLSVSARASSNIDTLSQFMVAVRYEASIASTAPILPDSELIILCQRAILWTSVDCGGVEDTFSITTDTGQAYYTIPDSVVEIISATLIRGRVTKSIKAFYPQYYEDVFEADEIELEGDDGTPGGFQMWKNMVQLMPQPIQTDSILFKCYIEHPYVDAVSDSIKLKPGYIEAAVVYTLHLVYRQMKEYDEAALYLTTYKDLKATLRGKYTPKLEVLPKQ